jgi:hypothetical protein
LKSQVLRNVIEHGTDPAAAQLMAAGLADQIWIVWLTAGLTTLEAGQALVLPSTPIVASAAAVVSCFAVAAALAIRQAERANRFLQAHLPIDDLPHDDRG